VEDFIFCLLQGKSVSPLEYSLLEYLRGQEGGKIIQSRSMVLFGTKQNLCEKVCTLNMKSTTSGQCIGLFEGLWLRFS